jgi:hypothetical protein
MENLYARKLWAYLAMYTGTLDPDLSMIASWPSEVSREALRRVLIFACCNSKIPAIVAGREALTKIPLDWLARNIDEVVEETLDLDDEFEFRRLLEALEFDENMSEKYIQLGLQSGVPDIAETADEFLKFYAKSRAVPSVPSPVSTDDSEPK